MADSTEQDAKEAIAAPVQHVVGGQSERILCAAIWVNDWREHDRQPRNVDFGYVVCGWRHHNCFGTLSALGYFKRRWLGLLPPRRHREQQGFLTSQGRFVCRDEGRNIAIKAGQVSIADLGYTLFSEDLY